MIFKYLLLLSLSLLYCLNEAAYGRELDSKALYFQNQPSIESILQNQQYTSTGTTIVGLCCSDGVVLGADTRSTGGPVVMDKNKLKIRPIAPRIQACGAGTSAVCEKITERARHQLALYNIDYDLALVNGHRNSVASAVQSIISSLHDPQYSRGTAVFIVGGLDNTGPKLYQIDDSKSPNRLAYGALGSGCTDALAVLESCVSHLVDDNVPYMLNIKCSEAIDIIRQAVRAGIMNDLGSGSHVDLCVITQEGTRQWREHLRSQIEGEQYRDSLERSNSNSENLIMSKASLGTKVWSKRWFDNKMENKGNELLNLMEVGNRLMDIQKL